MADSTAIAIVSVSVAGLAAIVGPAITALATGRGQRRQFEHELALHDRDELRERLERVAEILDELARIAGKQLYELELHGPAPERMDEAIAARRKLAEANGPLARLGLHLDREGAIVTAAQDSVIDFAEVIDTVALQIAMGGYQEGFSLDTMYERHEAGQAAVLRFLDAAQEAMARRRRRRRLPGRLDRRKLPPAT